MTMKGAQYILLALVLCFAATSIDAQNEPLKAGSLAESFLMEKDKPSVYIIFEKSGTAEALFDGESKNRYWLRLFNNTRGAVTFCSFKVSQEYGDTGLVYDLEEDRNRGSIGTIEPEIPVVKTKKDAINKSSKVKPGKPQKLGSEEIKTPHGYSTGDTCREFYLESGKSILFSIPKEHLTTGKRTFTMKMQFNYEWESEGTEIASHPLHLIVFSYGNLPFSERK